MSQHGNTDVRGLGLESEKVALLKASGPSQLDSQDRVAGIAIAWHVAGTSLPDARPSVSVESEIPSAYARVSASARFELASRTRTTSTRARMKVN